MAVSALRQQLRMHAAPIGGGRGGPLLSALMLVIRLYVAAALGLALIVTAAVIGPVAIIGWAHRTLSRGLAPA